MQDVKGVKIPKRLHREMNLERLRLEVPLYSVIEIAWTAYKRMKRGGKRVAPEPTVGVLSVPEDLRDWMELVRRARHVQDPTWRTMLSSIKTQLGIVADHADRELEHEEEEEGQSE